MTVTFRNAAAEAAAPVRSTAAEAPRSRPVPVGVYVLGGLGVAGLGSFAVLGALGKADESHLSSTCSPACSSSDVQGVRGKYLGADIALGVGVASLAGAAIWYVLRPTRDVDAATLSVIPTRGGTMVEWRTSL